MGGEAGMYIYPRLRKADALEALRRLEAVLASGEVLAAFPDGGHHPKAIFPVSDGTPVHVNRLEDLRARMTSALAGLGESTRQSDRRFDQIVGDVLNRWFEEEGRSIASHPEVWPYLTIVVLPDFATRRFGPRPDGKLPPERFLADRRNVFYRAYLRAWVLGPILNDPEIELYEDELVGLVDRSFSADHRLARRVAENLLRLSSNPSGRRHIARSSLKDIQYELRVTDMASLPEETMNALVDAIFNRHVELWRKSAADSADPSLSAPH